MNSFLIVQLCWSKSSPGFLSAPLAQGGDNQSPVWPQSSFTENNFHHLFNVQTNELNLSLLVVTGETDI